MVQAALSPGAGRITAGIVVAGMARIVGGQTQQIGTMATGLPLTAALTGLSTGGMVYA